MSRPPVRLIEVLPLPPEHVEMMRVTVNEFAQIDSPFSHVICFQSVNFQSCHLFSVSQLSIMSPVFSQSSFYHVIFFQSVNFLSVQLDSNNLSAI